MPPIHICATAGAKLRQNGAAKRQTELKQEAAMDGVSLISLRPAHDDRGDLIAIENKRDVPFDIARVYYLYNVPVNSSRGGHAHRSLRQVIFAMSGSFRLTVKNGETSEQIVLRDPGVGVLVENLIWREIDLFSQGSVCMVLASNVYDESDYIRDFDVYRAMVTRTL